MEFTLTIDLDKVQGTPAQELSRILKYWARTLDASDLTDGSASNVYDSSFARVGTWSVDSADADEQAA